MRQIIVAIMALLFCGCAMMPAPKDPLCRIEEEELHQTSGLVTSRTHPGIMWTHNDSGDTPRLFAITYQCEVIAEFQVLGVPSHDWEDITIDDAGNLYIGDIGTIFNRRKNLAVYRVPEPDPFREERVVRADRMIPFAYANQKGFPQLSEWNFDAEALFWMEGDLYIFTKHRSDRRTQLYRLPLNSGPIQPGQGKPNLKPIAVFDLGKSPRFYFNPLGNVTGAALHPDGKILAVLSYHDIFLFVRRKEEARLFKEILRIKLNFWETRQAESITWNEDRLIFGNEERYLFKIPNLD